ncbi:MAG: hypothetical protein IKS67_05010 [Victivallales bacterium]|nr:hypothetical protein [Victivallales bacterium]
MKSLISILCLAVSVSAIAAPNPLPQFSFTYRGLDLTNIPSSWTQERKLLKQKDKQIETITATEPDGVTLILEKTVYTNHPVVEWMLSFENHTLQPTGRFTRISAADFTLPFGKNEAVTLWKGIGEAPNPPDNYSFTRIPLEDEKSI